MTDNSHQWKEKEWERYVDALLSTHHSVLSESYQPVPDYKGDRGLEGFTNTGDAYQSYADQDSKTIEQRTEKQKKKIREDLNKLEKYAEFWAEVLGETKLKHWTLMVPYLEDKEVVKYARTKARQLAKKKLSFIDDSFFGDVKTAEQFPVAKAILRDPSLPRAESADATEEEIAAFRDAQPEFIKRLIRKLKKALPVATDEKIGEYANAWLRWHLNSANLLDNLLNTFPNLWETLDELIEVTGKSIETDEAVDPRAASHRLRETRQEFESKLATNEFGYLTVADRTTVSHGVVAKWLGECPLDFSGGDDG